MTQRSDEMHIWTNYIYTHMVKILVDYQTYREIELVWNFDLSMFSVYGGGACTNVLISYFFLECE